MEIKGLTLKSSDELEYEVCLKVNLPVYHFINADYISSIKGIESATQNHLQISKLAINKEYIVNSLEFNDYMTRWLLGFEYDYRVIY